MRLDNIFIIVKWVRSIWLNIITVYLRSATDFANHMPLYLSDIILSTVVVCMNRARIVLKTDWKLKSEFCAQIAFYFETDTLVINGLYIKNACIPENHRYHFFPTVAPC